jgi:hypothetical protein
MTRIRCTVGQREQEAGRRATAWRKTVQVSEIGDCRKKTRKQVPVTTRRPAFYFYGTRTGTRSPGPGLRHLHLHLHLLILPASPLSRLSGEMAAEFNFSDMHGCLRWLAWLPLGAAPTSPCDGAPFRCKCNANATIHIHCRLPVRLSAFCVKIAVSRLHENHGPLCCCPGSRPLTAGRLEPLYLWRTMMATIQ